MADGTYQPAVYRKQGSTEWVVASGGKFTVESGGVVDVESGGSFKLAGTAVAATAGELNLNDGQVAGVTWTISTTSAYIKTILGQLTDAAGSNIAGAKYVPIMLLTGLNSSGFIAMTTLDTLTTGANAAVCSVSVPVAGVPLAHVLSSTGGLFSLNWSDTGKIATYIGAVMPNGTVDVSTDAITTTG